MLTVFSVSLTLQSTTFKEGALKLYVFLANNLYIFLIFISKVRWHLKFFAGEQNNVCTVVHPSAIDYVIQTVEVTRVYCIKYMY